jgi:hypothetical protein
MLPQSVRDSDIPPLYRKMPALGFRQKDPPGMRLRLLVCKLLLGDQALIFHHQELSDLHLLLVKAGTGRRFGLLLGRSLLLVPPIAPPTTLAVAVTVPAITAVLAIVPTRPGPRRTVRVGPLRHMSQSPVYHL